MITFFKKARDYPWTILVVKDENNYIFGGFCLEEWRLKNQFFGSGENRLFTFEDGEEPEIFT